MKDIEVLEKIKKTCKSNSEFDCSCGKCPYSVRVTKDVITYWSCVFNHSPGYWNLDKLKNKEEE